MNMSLAQTALICRTPMHCVLDYRARRGQRPATIGSRILSDTISATPSGFFKIAGETPIARLGFGAMRLTGRGIWGPPNDPAGALEVLRRLPDLGVNFIDTADSYGPNVAESLIREALHPYSNIFVATKAGLARTGPDRWTPLGRPEYLIQQAYNSCRNLGVEQIDLWQLHRIDPKVPRGEQFDAVKLLLDTGVIRYAGLSEVSVKEIVAASKIFKVSTVQHRYNIFERESEACLDYCEEHGIGFIPWFPLGSGKLTQPGGLLDHIAERYSASTGQIALAWLLQRSPVMLPIPGTSQIKHLEENVAAAAIRLTPKEFFALDTGRNLDSVGD
jgi:pyridoxine 4-dehydrogenase